MQHAVSTKSLFQTIALGDSAEENQRKQWRMDGSGKALHNRRLSCVCLRESPNGTANLLDETGFNRG
jgi:hypothetical protein